LFVQAVNEFGDDAKVGSSTTNGPKEVGIRVVGDGEDLSSGRDESDLLDIVNGHAVSSHKPPITTTESEAMNNSQ
jgi:hypothetical protein